jgi:hypothetical protein
MQIQIKRYTRHLYMPAILMAFVVFLLAIAAISAKIAKADGYEGGYKDTPSHTYYSAPKRARLETPHRLRAYLSPEELRTLKRIKARAERRMMGYREPVRSRRVYAETRYEREPVRRVRYAESRRYTSDVVEIRGTRECKAPISVEGEERGSVSRARGNASDTWKRVTIARYGYRFADLDVARSPRYDCVVLRKNKFGWPIHSCSLAARPCRDM